MIKGLNNAQLVGAYKQAKRVFIQAVEGTRKQNTIDNIMTMLWWELDKRNIDLREYIG